VGFERAISADRIGRIKEQDATERKLPSLE
jgi:hypothetical protein